MQKVAFEAWIAFSLKMAQWNFIQRAHNGNGFPCHNNNADGGTWLWFDDTYDVV
jgi:hypothetical protein